MRGLLITVIFCLVGSIWGYSQTGKVFDDLVMSSKILKGKRKYAVYLPPDYDTSQRSYPVLYLLHGSGDDQTGWVQFGEVLRLADEGIKNGSATSMIVIMPDANTGQKGYFNTGDWKYEDFFFEEFMPFVEEKYRIKKEKKYRAVAGLSMGGGGAFMYALRYPELFSSACPLSAYVGALTIEDLKTQITRDSTTYTEEEIQHYFENYSALQLIASTPVEEIKSVKWYIDCGDDDFLYEGNSLVHIAMKKKEIPHEYRVRDGKHSWVYWRSALPEVLEFVSNTFHQN